MNLLEPIQVGKITLKNRIMFPPMTTGYEDWLKVVSLILY